MLPPPPNEIMTEAAVASILDRTEGLWKEGPRFFGKAFDPGLEEILLEGFFEHPSDEIRLLRTYVEITDDRYSEVQLLVEYRDEDDRTGMTSMTRWFAWHPSRDTPGEWSWDERRSA